MSDAEFDAIPHDGRNAYGPPFFKFAELDHGWSGTLFGYILYVLFKPCSAIEFGCGTGRVLASLRRCGVEVLGLDASPACVPFVHRNDPQIPVIIHDLRLPWFPPKKFDLAVSIETLEHIPLESADTAITSISSSAPLVVASACPPVGRNPLHLNEQPFDFWISLMASKGFKLNAEATTALRGIMRQFSDFHDHGRYPVIPAWYTSGYIGVFSSG